MVIASDETPVMSTDKGSLIFEEKLKIFKNVNYINIKQMLLKV